MATSKRSRCRFGQRPKLTIQRLSNLPDGWIANGPLARAMRAAPILIKPPFNLANMAGGVYDWGGGDLPTACGGSHARATCTADATGLHSVRVMERLLVAEHAPAPSLKPVVDGLSPATIRHIKAHSVRWWASSNWDVRQAGRTRPGDTVSYGGVLFEVNVGKLRRLRFIVAFSGDRPWKDQELALLVGNAIISDLVDEGYLTPAMPVSRTFIFGADEDEVDELEAAAS